MKLYAGTTEQFRADARMHRIAEKLRAELTGHSPTSTENAARPGDVQSERGSAEVTSRPECIELLEEGKKPTLPLLILPTYQQAERIPSKKAAEQQEMFG